MGETSVKQRTQISKERFGGEDIVWSPNEHTIDEITTEFPLPVLVKVVEGYMINDIECLETNTILSIHGKRRMQKFIAVDQAERRMTIPVTCKQKVVLRPTFCDSACKTVADICKLHKLPSYIMNETEFQSGKKTFAPHTTFSVIKSMTKAGSPALILQCTVPMAEEFTLPASAKVNFYETEHPDDIKKPHLLTDLTDRNLPLSVEFQWYGRDGELYTPRMGIVRLKELTETEVVFATSYEDGRRLLITFSSELKIKLQVGHIIVSDDNDTYSTVAEPVEEVIDERVLEHALHSDPYNGDYVNIDYDKIRKQFNDCVDKPPADAQLGQRGTPPELPRRTHKTEATPPKIPARKGTKGLVETNFPHKPERQDDNKYRTIANPTLSIKNKYVPAPKAPPPIPAKPRPGELPPYMQCKSQSTSTENPLDQRTRNAISLSLPLDQAASLEYPENLKRDLRPPLPIPRAEQAQRVPLPADPSLMAQALMEVPSDDGEYEQIDIQKKESPFNKTLKKSASEEIATRHAYEDVLLEGQTFQPLDTTLMALKSQPPAEYICMDGADVEIEKGKFSIDNTVMKSASGETATANQPYEAIQFHGQKLRPVDFTLMTSKSQASVLHPNYVYEDIVFDDATSYIDNKPKSMKPERPSFYDETLPTENPMRGHQEKLDKAWPPSHMEERPSADAGGSRPKGIDRFPSSDTQKAATYAAEDTTSSEQTINNNNPVYAEVSSDMIGKDVEDICDILDSLRLGDFKDDIESNQIDGELLMDIEENDLVSDLSMTLFQAKKLCLYVRGWRPDDERSSGDEKIETQECTAQESESDEKADAWAVSDVCRRMESIKLNSFATFCRENQVNGSLLANILDESVLDSVRTDHKVSLSKIQQRKLINYVEKGWRPK